MSHRAARKRTRTCSFAPAGFGCFSAVTSPFATVRRRRSFDTPPTWCSTAPSDKNFVCREDAFAHLRDGVLDLVGYREKARLPPVPPAVGFTSVADRWRRYCA